MHNEFTIKAANSAAQMMKDGFLPQYAIMVSAAAGNVTPSDVAKELNHRKKEKKAVEKKRNQKANIYKERRIYLYEN